MPTPTAAERLHAQQQKNRKAAGLPDPSEYKKKLDSMKSENYEEDDGPLSQEQLDEISSQLKASYVSGAKKQIKQSLPFTKKTDEYRDIAKNFIAKRQKGIAKANEEVEQLDEYESKSGVYKHKGKYGTEYTGKTIETLRQKDAMDLTSLNKGLTSRLEKGMDVNFGRKTYHQAQNKNHLMNVHKNLPEEVELLDEMPESSMKTRDVHSHLKKSGWALARSKGGHDVYKHPKAKHSIPVPRHNQLKAPLIRGIMKASKVEESFRIGGMGSRGGNIHMYNRIDTNPGPKDDSELENIPSKPKTELQKRLKSALSDLGDKMKKTHPKLREAKDSQEYDYEGDMAKSDLRSIMHHAKELHDMIEDTTNLAEWCQSKITLAEDYLSTVANYMRSEMNEETVQEDENDYQRKIDKNNKNFAAATKRQKNPLSNKKIPQGADFAAQRRKERLANSGRMDEGRASQRHPLEGHEYHKKSNDALVHIAKDAHAAAEAMKSHNTDAENKYRDQANDSATVRHFRKTSGMPDWYKKKYGHVKEEVEQLDEKKNLPGLWANIHAKRKRGESPAKPGDKDYPKTLNIESSHDVPFNKPYKQDTGTTTDKSGAKHTPMSKARNLAQQALSRTSSKKADTKQQARNAFDGMFGGGNPANKLSIMKKESASEPTEGEMKGKQGYSRKAQIVMNASKGKKSDSPEKYQKDPELSSEIHKT